MTLLNFFSKFYSTFFRRHTSLNTDLKKVVHLNHIYERNDQDALRLFVSGSGKSGIIDVLQRSVCNEVLVCTVERVLLSVYSRLAEEKMSPMVLVAFTDQCVTNWPQSQH